MKKRFLSLLCVLALCLGLLPVTAEAAEGAPSSLYVGNQQVISSSDITYWTTDESTGGLTKYEGNNDNWNVKYDQSTATLTLKNANISGSFHQYDNSYTAGIYAQGKSNQPVALTIELIGTNTITGTYGIFLNAEINAYSYGTNATLTITGENNGSLGVSGSGHGIYVKSGTGNASLNIKNVAVTSSTNGNYAAGVYVMSSAHATNSPNISLAVDGGNLTASGTGSSDGIWFYVGSSQATGATTSLTVSENAIVDARNGGISALKISETLPTPTPTGDNRSGIVFDGSTGTVYGSVTLQEDLTIGEGETLTIGNGASLDTNGKTITVESGGKLEGTPTGSGTVKIAPTITTESLPDGEVGTAYSQTLVATGSETITWSLASGSTMPAGLTLNSDGTITGTPTTADTSTFTVTAENSYGSDNKELSITISAPASVSVTGVSLNKDSLNLYVGGNETLTATVEPANATNQNVTWKSSNTSVATVDANGNITAVGAGTAQITVTTADGSFTAACAVTVEEPYTPPPYIPPTKTPSQQAIDKIEDAKEGSTVEIKLSTGSTKLDKEVFEELAGRDVTLEISLSNGVTWTVNGQDIPKNTDLTDLDMGVSLNTSTIPVNLINSVTGEAGTVQLTLKHNGEFGFTMTLTAPVGVKNAGLWANLYHYDEDAGKMVYQTAALVDEDGNVALPFDHASQYALVLDSKSHDLPFTDLAADAWYTDAVAYVYRHDLMAGYGENLFGPDDDLSRAQLCQIIYNMEGQPATSGSSVFTDVADSAWYADAVTWAASQGIVGGYGGGLFGPEDNITREQLAAILYRYAQAKGYDTSVGENTNILSYTDALEISEYAIPAMQWACGARVINGTGDGSTLTPQGQATRAQAAVMLMRFCENYVTW